MAYTAADLRKGLKIEMEGIPYEVVEFQFVKPGKGQAMYKCRIKNMLLGTTMDKTFRAVDKIDTPNIESKTLAYSYQEGDKFIFMDNKSYEQVEIHQDVLGDQRFFLLEDLECEVLFFNGRAMTVTLPGCVDVPSGPTDCLYVGQVFSYTGPGRAVTLTVTQAMVDKWIALGKPDCWCCLAQKAGNGVATNTRVDTGDLNELKQSWNKTSTTAGYKPCADYNLSGRVDTADLNVLKAHWNKITGGCE